MNGIRSNVGYTPGTENDPSARQTEVVERLAGEFIPNAPWDFPPGTPGADGGPEVPRDFAKWLNAHDERMVVTWQPVTRTHVIWRMNEEGEFKCVMPCANPFEFVWADLAPGQPVPQLDNRMKWLLMRSDPETFGGEAQMLKAGMDQLAEQEERVAERQMEVMRQARDVSINKFRPMVGSGARISGKKVSTAYK